MKVSPSIRAFDPSSAPSPGVSLPGVARARRPSRFLEGLRRWRAFIALVLLPTALVGGYYFGYAADQFASQTRFLVRGKGGSSATGFSVLGDALSNAGFKSSSEEALAVRDFLRSHDAVQGVARDVDLVAIWRRPEADLIARLMTDDPSAETLLKYYNRMVTAEYDTETGSVSLEVKAFRPEDARQVTEALLRQSEALVNGLSERQREDTLSTARAEVQRAEARVLAAREAVTQFRTTERAVDPTREVAANVQVVSGLEAALTQTRAELGEKQGYMRPDNPQILTLRNRIGALERQIAVERARLTDGGAQSAPQQLAGYERLLLEREFADRQLASATTGLETARLDAARQQLYVARVVSPNLAERALYPKALFITGSVFLVLCVVYGIGSLLYAGFREHAS